MPVLIAAGAKDLFMNIEKTMELVHGISQAEFYLAPEGGHVHQWEYPEPYDSVVVGFLMNIQRKQNNVYRYEYVD